MVSIETHQKHNTEDIKLDTDCQMTYNIPENFWEIFAHSNRLK